MYYSSTEPESNKESILPSQGEVQIIKATMELY